MANALALRLRRLEAIREAAEQLIDRPQLGRDVFARGEPEPIAEIKRPEWSATLYDLLSAYAAQRQNQALVASCACAKRTVWSLAEAREALERLVGRVASTGARSTSFSLAYLVEPAMRATVLASSFAATLELVREGQLEVHQHAAFRADLSAQARRATRRRRRGRGNGEWVRGRPRLDGECGGDACDRRRQATRATRSSAGGAAPARGAAVRRRASRSTRRPWPTRLPEGVDVRGAARAAAAEYAPRGVNLVHVAGKWTFRTANDLAWLLTHEAVGDAQSCRAPRSRRSPSSPITSR